MTYHTTACDVLVAKQCIPHPVVSKVHPDAVTLTENTVLTEMLLFCSKIIAKQLIEITCTALNGA